MIALVALLAVADASSEYDAIVRVRREGRFAEAAAQFEAFAAKHVKDPIASRALASAGAIYQWDLEDLARARLMYDRVLRGPLDSPGVMPSLIQRLELERDAGGEKAELALAEAIFDRAKDSEVAPYLLMRIAELYPPPRAARTYAEVRRRYPKSTRADEAAMREAKILRSLGRAADAIPLYRGIIETQASSFIVGEYNSTKLDDAYFQLAETYREQRDVARAIEAYETMIEEMPLSILVDDAYVRLADLDPKRAAEFRKKLAEARPHSRFLRKK